MMSGNCTSKKELLQSIDQVSFAIDDLLLFLDTHQQGKNGRWSISANFLPEEMNFWKNMQNFMVR